MPHLIENKIRDALFAMRDEGYAKFQSKLMPTVSPARIIGVRTPRLRAYAKKIAGSDESNAFLSFLPHTYYEENNLHAALLEHIREFDVALDAVEKFLPYIDNWATCDGFCPKVLLTDEKRLLERIGEWLASDRVYTVRYALVRLTAWYLDAPRFSADILNNAAAVAHDDYYVRMAQAWLFSVALVKQYDATLPYLTAHRLDAWVHNKAIQKAVESYRVPPEIKSYLKTLKRRETTKKENTP